MNDPLLRTLRVRNDHHPGVLGRLASALGAAGANVGDIRTVWVGPDHIERDIDILVADPSALDRAIRDVRAVAGVSLIEVIDAIHDFHLDGKIEVRATRTVRTLHDLGRVYTPGVAEVVRSIVENPDDSYLFTIRGKTVALVTNGTRVLGLGNVGPVAALPVMEGKAALLHQFVGVSAMPIVLAERDPDAIVETVKRFAPGFGAIQLEDIESPACFRVEERLIAELEMPVMHDDQHGTAAVALAATLNAVRRAGLRMVGTLVGVVGLGAAGTAIARMIMAASERPVLAFDPNPAAVERVRKSGAEPVATLDTLMRSADVVIAVSGRAGLIAPAMVRKGQVILALSNPIPEIAPEEALRAGAAFAADGRSVNNLLGFPGILRASLDTRARRITREMYVAAAHAIAAHAMQGELVPNPLRRDVHRAVARAVALAAHASGAARVDVPTDYMQVEQAFRELRRRRE